MYLFYAVCVVWKGLKLKEVGWSPAPFLPRKVGVPEGRCPAGRAPMAGQQGEGLSPAAT